MPPVSDQLVDWVLQTIRTRESGGNYTARNKWSSASGAYQFIDDTWLGLGGGRYAPRAYLASKAQQDEIARRYVQDIIRRHGVEAVPVIWYVGHIPQNLDYVPGRGNRLTVRQYRDQWLGDLAKISGGQTPSAGSGRVRTADGGARQVVLDAAFSALGVWYKWAGNSLANGVDCSGLVQQAFRQVGIELPRVSADQARFGRAVGANDLLPGDLIWWDNSTRNVGADHIGIYIGQKNGVHYYIHAPGNGKQVRIDKLNLAKATGFTRIDFSGADPSRLDPSRLGRSGQRWSTSEWATDLLTLDAGGNASLGRFLEMGDEEIFETHSTRVSMPSWRFGLPDRSLPDRGLPGRSLGSRFTSDLRMIGGPR